jgi:hypothetical protein
MSDHDAVAAALARLVNGAPSPAGPARRPAPAADQSNTHEPVPVITEANSACARLATAAAFVESGGEQRLSRAVEEARRAGDRDGAQSVVERGTALLATLERYRVAADGTDPELSSVSVGSSETRRSADE